MTRAPRVGSPSELRQKFMGPNVVSEIVAKIGLDVRDVICLMLTTAAVVSLMKFTFSGEINAVLCLFGLFGFGGPLSALLLRKRPHQGDD